MSLELIRIVDGLSREKNIDKDLVITDLEEAMKSAIRKKYNQEEGVEVVIDRVSGDIIASLDGEPIDMNDLGRIAAQTAKQVMIQRIREAERGSIFEEFVERKLTIITGAVARFEGGALVVNIGRTEGFLPRSEQIPGEAHQPGERIRTLILDVREAPHQVKIILSRSHPDFIRRLFELEVPEVAERIIEIKALAREAGYRTKVAVSSIDTRVDAVGACVGVRGSRIKNIVEELGGEKIDIVRWNESSQILIGNALKPAEIQDTALCFEMGRATVVVPEDQLSLAIGKRGQNVRLAARLTGWDIDILTPKEYNRGLDRLAATLRKVEGVDEVMAERVSLLGLISVMDVEEVGAAPLVKELELAQELAEQIVQTCTEEAKIVQTELAKEKEEKERERAEQLAAEKAAAEAGADGASDAAADDAAGETKDGAVDASSDDAGETASETGSDEAAAEAPSSDSQEEPEGSDAEAEAVDEAAEPADATGSSPALSPEAETETVAKTDGEAEGESPTSPSAAVGDAETSPTD